MKYLKDKKVTIWSAGEWHTNDEGVMVKGSPEQLGEVWAHVRGDSYKEYFAVGATWDKPHYVVIISRPAFELSAYQYVKFDGVVYNIKGIDRLEDKPRGDVKLYVEKNRDQDILDD